MTADLGDRLAAAIDAAAEPVTPDEAVARGRRQRRQRRGALALVTAGAVGIAAVTFATTRPSGQSRLNVAAPTTSTHPKQVVAPQCTAADLRRPWPPMPQPARVVKRYVLDDQSHIDPAPDARPHVSASRAWIVAKNAMISPKSQVYPPAGGTGTIAFGYMESNTAVPISVHRLAWVVVLRNTAQNAVPSRGERISPPPNPPCYFGHEYAVIDAITGKWLFGGGQGGVEGDTIPSNPASLQPFPATKAPAPGAVTTTTDQTRDASLDLHTVDWKNIAVPGPSCLRSADIQLHNGDALVPDHTNGHPIRPGSNGPRYDDLYQERVTYGDFEGDGHDDAAVPLDCSNNGGTADGAILYSVAVYSGRAGKLTQLGLITPKHQPPHVLPTLLSVTAIAPGMITVHEDWYGPNDGTCCPNGRATTSWSLSAGKLTVASTKVTELPK